MTEIPFAISLWSGPPTDLARFQEVAEAGFTLLPVAAETPQAGRHALDLAREVGLQAVIRDARIRPDLPTAPDWRATVRAVVQDYADHPALYGYFLMDEPHRRHFEHLALLTRAFQEADPTRVPYINLFPNCASPDHWGTLEYRHYVRSFLEVVRPPLLSYDHYALMEWGDRPEYFANLAVIRAEALRATVPFWNIILATPHFAYRDPSAAELRWQVYTTLAYGGKGIVYFTYWTHDAENFRDGIIALYGHRTAKYDTVRQLNLEMRQLGPHLARLTSTGVYHWPDAPQGADVLPGDRLVASIEGGQFVVGEFVDGDGTPWLMVVNRSYERSAWTTLRLRTAHTALQEVGRIDGRLRPIARDQGADAAQRYDDGLIVQFWLAPADGRLLRVGGAD